MKVDKVIKILEFKGYIRLRQSGSHITMSKPGLLRPIVLVKHNQSTEVSPRLLKIILNLI